MTDIHDIKPLLSAPFPWLMFLLSMALLAWSGYKLYLWIQARRARPTPPPPPKPMPPFDYKKHTLQKLHALLNQVDALYAESKEAYLYALLSYWIRFYLEHHTKHAALTMTKTEVKKLITQKFETYLAQCYRIEFAKQTSDVAKTKEFITLLIEEIKHGV